MTPRILAAGDQALTVELSCEVDEAVNARVIALARSLADDPIPGVEETVPTYRSLLVLYDPGAVRGAALGPALLARLETLDVRPGAARLWRVPVEYGGETGLDLEEMARMKEMSPDELIALHGSAEYRVHMIGFAPGFTYLGGLPERLHTPRRATPRQVVAASSIGIGGKQASVNSVAGPSGWRFLGRTPLVPFDPAREEPFLFRAGDRIRFHPVTSAEAARLDAALARGETPVTPEVAA
ncbi:5-oxoprolinase subunit PxpB [Paroceanicella profunda]|uniref:5-oxoprolinase subunit PxpB n=1 Tax=Paroceanicella profunda TaxID=2579971 RepID=A0A5B8FV11_9RHOB|nr:5-oxoprolinase subunit PxpB [Paroceanicella profunda]QDL91164.1 5-oxoprolinase subunit PxpB [Paroceanicella profunda]